MAGLPQAEDDLESISEDLGKPNCPKSKLDGTKLYVNITSEQWPLVYSPDYDIGFLKLEKLHPFDSAKWGKIRNCLIEQKMVTAKQFVKPVEASEADLLFVHTKQYIDSLTNSWTVAQITEVVIVALLPNAIVQRRLLRPFRFQTGGTILAPKLAMERGWAINIGGGFHHCSAEKGGGFCAYADLTLAIRFAFERLAVTKAMIVDLDAHQGNGHERDFMNVERVYILDVYNRNIYPHDGYAKKAIRKKVELEYYTKDREYHEKVNTALCAALEEFTPDLIVYNAGTDILRGDPLGCLSISPEGIVRRDEMVFTAARTRNIPIMMVTSGGYQRETARIIAQSILNLRDKGLIEGKQGAGRTGEELPTADGTVSTERNSLVGGFLCRIFSSRQQVEHREEARTEEALQ